MKYQLIHPIKPQYSVIEQILTNRNISLSQIPHYLNTTDADVAQPTAFGLDKIHNAAAALIKTISNDEGAIVVVDADCDGFTSAAVLINYLHDIFPFWVQRNLGYCLHEGKQHGLQDHIEKLLQFPCSLVLVPDAGSNNAIQCTKLKQDGKNVIILDHHICDINNPDAIVINNQLSQYPNKDLSGVGVVWQFCRYLDSLLNTSYANNYLDLVALGLCADMMSMTSIETKHLVNKGFQHVTNPFFYCLAEKNAYSMKNKINHTSVAFYIAPYVNAICRSGTIEEKRIVFESMLTYKAFRQVLSTKRGHAAEEKEQLVEQAIRIATNVKARQTKAQDAGLNLLENMIESQDLLKHKVLLFLLEPGQIDKNIAGLSANKLMAKYQRPVCVLTKVTETQDDTPPWEESAAARTISYQGSARGCEKVGVFDFKNICAETGLVQYCAGHPNAFGLGILQDNVQAFIAATDAALKDMNDQATYYVDYIYQGNNVNPEDLLAIADMESLWGQNVDQPLLCIEHFKVTADMVTIYQKKDNTLKITLPNGVSLMKFKATDEQCQKLQSNPFGYFELNIVGKANKNQWMGNISAQLFIEQYEIIDSNNYIF